MRRNRCGADQGIVRLPTVGRAGSQGFAVEGISVESFRAEIQVGRAELFGLAEEKVSAGFEIEMQAFEQGDALGAGEVRQHVHAEDAVEASDVARAGKIHAIESD
jgi:hypothetical protein